MSKMTNPYAEVRIAGLSQIITADKAAQLDHPKTQEYKCLEIGCDSKLILCSIGEENKVAPYFRHSGDSVCKKNYGTLSNGESNEHKEAKYLLYKHLNYGGKINIVQKCKDNCKTRLPIIRVEGKAATEVKLVGGGYADVALFKGEDIMCLLEVMHTSKTESRSYPWYEVDSKEVLSVLTWDRVGNEITLNDIHPITCDQCKNKPLFTTKKKPVVLYDKCPGCDNDKDSKYEECYDCYMGGACAQCKNRTSWKQLNRWGNKCVSCNRHNYYRRG